LITSSSAFHTAFGYTYTYRFWSDCFRHDFCSPQCFDGFGARTAGWATKRVAIAGRQLSARVKSRAIGTSWAKKTGKETVLSDDVCVFVCNGGHERLELHCGDAADIGLG